MKYEMRVLIERNRLLHRWLDFNRRYGIGRVGVDYSFTTARKTKHLKKLRKYEKRARGLAV